MTRTILIGAPVDSGQRQPGCLMGPSAYRVAGIAGTIRDLGHQLEDWGDAKPATVAAAHCANPMVDQLPETLGWTLTLADEVSRAPASGGVRVVLGCDDALALGSVSGAARHAKAVERPLFLLWLDAHSDFHTPLTTTSGNLHGTPVAYIAGRAGFDAFPPFPD